MMSPTARQAICICLLLSPFAEAAPPRDVLSLSLEELARLPVTVASGFTQPQTEVAGTAFVMRAAQWEALGAQSVYDVLDLVPGLQVVESGRPERHIVARGLLTSNNSQVLWLLDGLPLNDLNTGSAPLGFDKGLAGLERIEVIRGPVSVIHGSNAFSAVINLVSQAAGSTASRVGVKRGSFDSREALAETGGSAGDWRWRLSLEGRRNAGDPDRIVPRDVQSTLDALFGTQASRTPGPLPTADDVQEALLNLAWRNTSLQAWHWRNDAGGRLDNGGYDPGHRNEAQIDHFSLKQSGELTGVATRWELEGMFQRQDLALANTVLPPGTIVPIGSNGDLDFVAGTPVNFLGGFVTRMRVEGDRKRMALNLLNSSWSRHTLRLGLGREWQELRELESRRSFGPGVADGSQPVVPATPLPNLAGTPLSLLTPDRRHLSFIALQDDWHLTDTVLLNIGVRHDRYSDFGNSTNPRVSLQWQATPATRWRLGYGTAFRAPSFNEQNLRNNPAILGNPALKAEELKNTELGVEHAPFPGLQLSLTAFRYDARGLVDYAQRPPSIGNVAQNIEGREGRGGTAELNWQPQPGARLNASVSVWNVKDTATGTNAPFVPGHLVALNGWWEFSPHWTLGASVKHVADRQREAGDARADIDDNSWADLHLHTTVLAPGLKLGLTVQNVADTDLRDPTPNNLALGAFTPDDLPLPGRAVLLEASYSWGQASAEPSQRPPLEPDAAPDSMAVPAATEMADTSLPVLPPRQP